MSRLLLVLVSVPTLVLSLVGCGGGPDVVTLVIDPPTVQLEIGQVARFTAGVGGTTNGAVEWAATGGELIVKGTAATFIASQAGSFEVRATSLADPDVSAVATVDVSPPRAGPHIRFVTDGSLVLAGVGATARVEVEVIDEHGAIVEEGQVTWSSSDQAVASIQTAGARAAVVTTETADTAQALLTASYQGLEASASLLVTRPSAGTVLIGSESVLAKTDSTVTLRRTPVTEAIAAGQRVVSGSGAGVLVEVVAVAVEIDTVELATVPTSLSQAFDELAFNGTVTPLELSVQLIDGRSAVVTSESQAGGPRSATVVDDVTCIAGGTEAPVDLEGSSITVTATIYGELSFSVLLDDDHFLAEFGTLLQVGATTGSVGIGGSFGGTAICALELPRLGLEPLSAGVMTMWTGLVPVLGVEVSATGAATSFTLSGPHGGLGAVLEGGIEYTEQSGWTPLFHSEFDASFEPFSAEASFEKPLTARLAPFGRVDIGVGLDLGVGALATPIIDARFVELKAYGYLDFDLPDPTDVGSKAYAGPAWTLGVGARGALKAEFQGLLPDLLEYIGIEVGFAGQLELFEEESELLGNPSLAFLAVPGTVEIPADGSTPVTLTAFAADDADGIVSFWASKDGASSLTFLTSTPLEGGVGSTSWHVAEEGEYELYARMSTDAGSLVKPYAANNTASVSATLAEDEGEDRGPLGNEGPYRGYYTHFSLGQCHGTGVALTIDFKELPNGQLTGTYVGHYCTGGCLDIEPYPGGPVAGTLSGSRSGADVTFTLSSPVGGVFTGERWVPQAPPGSQSLPVIDGFAEGVLPCEDEYGVISSGFFSFVGTEGISF